MAPILPRASNIEASNVEPLRDRVDEVTGTHIVPDQSQNDPVANFEGEIREFVRRDVAPSRRLATDPNTADFAANNINSLVHRVAGTSLQEIDSLIVELTRLREYLAREGERVQREIAGYAQLSQATMNSTKIIAESIATWKRAMDGAARTN
jgi:hypothetical protein